MADITRIITIIDIMRIGFTGMVTGTITDKRGDHAGQRASLGSD